MRRAALRALRVLPGVIALAACGAPSEPTPSQPDATPPAEAGRSWERALVFTTLGADSTLVVPWIFETATRADEAERSIRSWMYRGESWELFLEDSWQSRPTSAPWRLLPRPGVRLVVGPGDALASVIHPSPSRALELEFLDSRVEWSANVRESITMSAARLHLADAAVEGMVFDLSRARETAAGVAGDFVVLVSGDSLQIALQTPRVLDPDDETVPDEPWSGFARLNLRTIPISDAQLVWTGRQAFYRARRDVPNAWAISSAASGLWASMRVRSALLAAGEGPGPRFPIEGVFTVAGRVVFEGVEYPVQGFYHHVQNP